jgi:hypothetical protein
MATLPLNVRHVAWHAYTYEPRFGAFVLTRRPRWRCCVPFDFGFMPARGATTAIRWTSSS